MELIPGGITSPRGFLAQGVCAGIKNYSKKDMAVIYSKTKCTAAGVFTTNRVRAACIDLNKSYLSDGCAQAIVANSGNANACTGKQGDTDAQQMAEHCARQLNLEPEQVMVASTGVIGVSLPMDKIKAGIEEACAGLSINGAGGVAEALMTTDLVTKEIAVEVLIDEVPVKVAGVAKGSGMIHPNMATMLAFITTDAAVSSDCLCQLLKESADVSYNMISVDRDTSTNDMAVILANGQAGNPIIDNPDRPDYQLFKAALDYVNISLAKMIARDGEGANHLIEIRVINAADEYSARMIARSISSSNLTKAAVFGGDANWGRILAAAGYSGADFEPYLVNIFLGSVLVAEGGMGLKFDEKKAREELQKDTVVITVDMHAGKCRAIAWGCDLSYDYVRINADYRT